MKCDRRFLAFLLASALSVCISAEEAVPNEEVKPEFKPTKIQAPFLEQFTDDWTDRWSPSKATKEKTKDEGEIFSYVGTWSVEEPTVFPGILGDKGLIVKSKAAHHAISAPIKHSLDSTNKSLVVQYEVKLQNGLECGGAYLKLLTESEKGIHAEQFSDKTPYTIMFGPDKCGGTNKVHFIFRHKNLKSGEYEEKHMESAPSAKISKLSTLYTLIVKPDNSFEILINNESTKTGNLLNDFKPSVNPSKEIDDPKDKKPDNWVDDPKIPDPNAKKPSDWDEDEPREIPDEDAKKPEGWLDDEPDIIPDPEAKKPEDWVEEDDGDWAAPSIPNPKCEEGPGCGEWKRPMKNNPKYKGKWYPPEIDNPAYKGLWAPRKIPNPDYFEDLHPSKFEKIAAIGFEIWTMQNDILFDNIYIGHSEEDAKKLAEETWAVKYKIEKAAEELETKPAEKTPQSFWDDPVGYLQSEVNDFLVTVLEDPVETIKQKPEIAGLFGGATALLLILLTVLFNLMTRKPSAPHKKTDEPTPDDKDADKTDANSSQGDGGDEGRSSNNASNASKRKKTRKDD